jgi:hypothetical protein
VVLTTNVRQPTVILTEGTAPPAKPLLTIRSVVFETRRFVRELFGFNVRMAAGCGREGECGARAFSLLSPERAST